MLRLINFLRGRVTVQATGAFPEHLINLCAGHAVAFWGVEWIDETSFRFTVALQDWRKVKQLAQKAMCELSAPVAEGVPVLVFRLRKRIGFLLGLSVFLVSMIIFSRFLMVVEVTGNEQVPEEIILSELRRQGVKPGAYIPGIDENDVANRALIGLKDLSFLSVNLHGCRAEIIVREADKVPELLEEKVPADIVSTAAGIVIDVDWTAGQPLVEQGDTVVEGDVLITGFMDLPEYTYSEVDMGTYVVHAAGKVTARTWRTLKSMVPLRAQLKDLTGAERNRWSINYPGGRFNFYQNSGISYERYDKITKTRRLVFPSGKTFPISLTQERIREYSLTDGNLNRDEAIDLLKAGLRRELDDILQTTDGECIRLDYMATVEDDILTVTMLAECVEQIGKTVEREGKTGFIPPSLKGADDGKGV